MNNKGDLPKTKSRTSSSSNTSDLLHQRLRHPKIESANSSSGDRSPTDSGIWEPRSTKEEQEPSCSAYDLGPKPKNPCIPQGPQKELQRGERHFDPLRDPKDVDVICRRRSMEDLSVIFFSSQLNLSNSSKSDELRTSQSPPPAK